MDKGFTGVIDAKSPDGRVTYSASYVHGMLRSYELFDAQYAKISWWPHDRRLVVFKTSGAVRSEKFDKNGKLIGITLTVPNGQNYKLPPQHGVQRPCSARFFRRFMESKLNLDKGVG